MALDYLLPVFSLNWPVFPPPTCNIIAFREFASSFKVYPLDTGQLACLHEYSSCCNCKLLHPNPVFENKCTNQFTVRKWFMFILEYIHQYQSLNIILYHTIMGSACALGIFHKTILWRACNLTVFTHSSTGLVVHPYASRHEGPRFRSQGGYLCKTGILLLTLFRCIGDPDVIDHCGLD